MKHIIIFLLLLSVTNILVAQDKKIAMMQPIKNSEGIKDMVSDMVRGELTKSLTREAGFSAFSRNDLDKVAEEYKFQESGMVDDDQRRKIGQMTGADYVCISKISKDGNAYYIQGFLINIETGQISDPGTAFAEGGLASVNLACKTVAADMVGKKITIQQPITNREISSEPNSTSNPRKNKENMTIKSSYPKVDYNDNFKISITSLNRKGNSIELFFTVKNEGNKSQYFSSIGYNGWEFKLHTKSGDVYVASNQPSYGIKQEFAPGITLKRRVLFRNVPNQIDHFSHLTFVSRPAYTGSAGKMTHSIENLPVQSSM